MFDDEEFDRFCRFRYERISLGLDLLGIENDESFESFKLRNYEQLQGVYINSMDTKTIH